MGTNFYWIDPDQINVPTDFADRSHVGKRSAAGWYCYDCNVPLVRGGDSNLVHTCIENIINICPKCGQHKPETSSMPPRSALIELGLAKPRTGRQTTGVSTCSSFSWAQDPAFVKSICESRASETIVADEYGREFTGQEFIQMLFANCPIEFTYSIGRDFD